MIGIKPLQGKAGESNTSLGPIQLQVKRCLNKSGLDAGSNEDALRLLEKVCVEKPLSGVRYINAWQYDRLADDWREDNERISQDFLQGRALFESGIPGSGAVPLYEVPNFEFSVYVELMLRHFRAGETPALRQLFARATLFAIADLKLWGVLHSDKGKELIEWATGD